MHDDGVWICQRVPGEVHGGTVCSMRMMAPSRGNEAALVGYAGASLVDGICYRVSDFCKYALRVQKFPASVNSVPGVEGIVELQPRMTSTRSICTMHSPYTCKNISVSINIVAGVASNHWDAWPHRELRVR